MGLGAPLGKLARSNAVGAKMIDKPCMANQVPLQLKLGLDVPLLRTWPGIERRLFFTADAKRW